MSKLISETKLRKSFLNNPPKSPILQATRSQYMWNIKTVKKLLPSPYKAPGANAMKDASSQRMATVQNLKHNFLNVFYICVAPCVFVCGMCLCLCVRAFLCVCAFICVVMVNENKTTHRCLSLNTDLFL